MDSRITFKVITAAQRIPLVNLGAGTQASPAEGVDLVARAMTMNCDRWVTGDPAAADKTKKVAFSAVYLLAQQRLLVRRDSPARSIEALAAAKARVCAPKGSTSLAKIQTVAGVQPVAVDIHSDCLALWQEGEVDAITGDDAILAGFKDQDPQAVVVGESLEAEPYGLAVSVEHPEFVQFVNAVLASPAARADWTKAYNTYLAAALGPPTAPVPDYSRPLP